MLCLKKIAGLVLGFSTVRFFHNKYYRNNYYITDINTNVINIKEEYKILKHFNKLYIN